MNCQEIQTLLHAYGDGELDAAKSIEIGKHLQICPQCNQVWNIQSTLKKAVATHAPYFKAPAGLRANIIAAAAAEQPRQSRMVRHWDWNTLSAGLAMAACLVIGFFLALQYNRHSAEGLLINELTASHVRSLLATHLMDVVSTDQHTVKPWFDGKLGFAPPVSDLASEGYPLIGGRLDYIDGRTVAVLVYKKEKHIINVFIWPSSASPGTSRRAGMDGYNLVNWNSQNMTFWAVSDVNAASLQELATLLKASPPAPEH